AWSTSARSRRAPPSRSGAWPIPTWSSRSRPSPSSTDREAPPMAPLEARDPALRDLVAPDAPIERVAGGLTFTEGPVWKDGALLFSDIPNKRIARWRRLAEGPELTSFATGTSNGLTLDRQGRVLAAEHDGRRVSRVAADGT